MNGTLNDYLKNVNRQAEEMFFSLIEKMKQAEGVTEKLKRRDQMAWVGKMNVIRSRAEEIVLSEMIFEQNMGGEQSPPQMLLPKSMIVIHIYHIPR